MRSIREIAVNVVDFAKDTIRGLSQSQKGGAAQESGEPLEFSHAVFVAPPGWDKRTPPENKNE